MMHIPVDDQNALDTVLPLRVARGDRHIVE